MRFAQDFLLLDNELAAIEAEQKAGLIRSEADYAKAKARRARIFELRRRFRRLTAKFDDVDRRRMDTWERTQAAGKPGPKPGRKMPAPPPAGRKGSGRFMPQYVTEKR